jgi:hypothetical protein
VLQSFANCFLPLHGQFGEDLSTQLSDVNAEPLAEPLGVKHMLRMVIGEEPTRSREHQFKAILPFFAFHVCAIDPHLQVDHCLPYHRDIQKALRLAVRQGLTGQPARSVSTRGRSAFVFADVFIHHWLL